MNRSWGGNLEIAAMSEHYKVGIVVWELSRAGVLVTPFDNTPLAASKSLKNLNLSRHRGVHFKSVLSQNQKLPLDRAEVLPLEILIRYGRSSSINSFPNKSGKNIPSLSPTITGN